MACPFLEMPAELRNSIYEDVLIHDRDNGKFAAVGLLATCRQVRDEATDVFRSLSVFSVKFQSKVAWDRDEDVSLSGDMQLLFNNNTSIIDFWNGLSSLRLPDTIRITLDVENYGQPKSVSRFLYAIANCLNASPTARHTIFYKLSQTGSWIPTYDVAPYWSLYKIDPRHELILSVPERKIVDQIHSFFTAETCYRERMSFKPRDIIADYNALSIKVHAALNDQQAGDQPVLKAIYTTLPKCQADAETLLNSRKMTDGMVDAKLEMYVLSIKTLLGALGAETDAECKESCQGLLRMWYRLEEEMATMHSGLSDSDIQEILAECFADITALVESEQPSHCR